MKRGDFYIEHDTSNTNEKNTKIETKSNDANDYKVTPKVTNINSKTKTETFIIPNDLINYEEVNSKVGKLGISMNIKKSVIDGKIEKLELVH